MSDNTSFDYSGVAHVFRDVQELRDKEHKTTAEEGRLKNLEELQSLALDGIAVAKELIPIIRKQIVQMDKQL